MAFIYSFSKRYHIYPTPPLRQDMTQGQFFKRSFPSPRLVLVKDIKLQNMNG